jgi:protoheme IX farnesyltransferase
MMPVVRGEKETRWQILIYTLELVAVTLLMPVLKLTGTIYLVSAVGLGLWLTHIAWQVWRKEGNKIAWKMYRSSSMYLAFIFLALMLDAVL